MTRLVHNYLGDYSYLDGRVFEENCFLMETRVLEIIEILFVAARYRVDYFLEWRRIVEESVALSFTLFQRFRTDHSHESIIAFRVWIAAVVVFKQFIEIPVHTEIAWIFSWLDRSINFRLLRNDNFISFAHASTHMDAHLFFVFLADF